MYNYLYENMPYSLTTVALESKANPFTMMSSVMKNQIIAITKATAEHLTSSAKTLLQFSDPTNAVVMYDKRFEEQMKQVSYPDAANLYVPVPRGFTGNLLGYTALLDDTYGKLEQLLEKTLKPADAYISLCISHPEDATGLKGDTMYSKIELHKSTMDQFQSAVKPFYSKEPNETLPYGKVFARKMDHMEYDRMAITLARMNTGGEVKKIRVQVEQIAAKANLLHVRISTGKVTSLSNIVIERIATLLDGVAKVVEFYAAQLQLIDKVCILRAEIKHTMQMMLDLK